MIFAKDLPMIYRPELTTLIESLRFYAAERPDHVAVQLPDGTKVTYAQLDANSTRVAARLHSMGVNEGGDIRYR